jgi:mercuric ion binding protein
MKKYIIIVLVAMMGVTVTAQDKNARATIEVDGVCGMCKKRIETAAIKTKGVKSAVWNVETKECSLIFDARKTNLATIGQSIADVGHDTKEIKATEEAYNSVHPCCMYRDVEVQKDHENN